MEDVIIRAEVYRRDFIHLYLNRLSETDIDFRWIAGNLPELFGILQMLEKKLLCSTEDRPRPELMSTAQNWRFVFELMLDLQHKLKENNYANL